MYFWLHKSQLHITLFLKEVRFYQLASNKAAIHRQELARGRKFLIYLWSVLLTPVKFIICESWILSASNKSDGNGWWSKSPKQCWDWNCLQMQLQISAVGLFSIVFHSPKKRLAGKYSNELTHLNLNLYCQLFCMSLNPQTRL